MYIHDRGLYITCSAGKKRCYKKFNNVNIMLIEAVHRRIYRLQMFFML